MKTLFNTELETYSSDALQAEQDLQAHARPIMDTLIKQGYKVREISYVLQEAIKELELETLLNMRDRDTETFLAGEE